MTNKELAQSLQAVARMVEWDYPINFAGDLQEAAKRLRECEPNPLKDLGTVCVCAVRYCLGRTTYMPQLVSSFIRKNVDLMSDNSLYVMVRDIEDCKNFGMATDEMNWWRFHHFLKNTIAQRENERKDDVK